MIDDVTLIAPPSSNRREGGATSFLQARSALALLAMFALSAACGDAGGIDARAVMAAGMAGAAGMPALAGSSAGAAGSSAAGQTGSGGGGSGGGGGGLSFTEVYDRVINVRCAACHNDAPSFGGLAFFPGGAATAYANLVGVPAGQDAAYKCHDSGLLRVKPGDPEHSLIYLKLTAPPCGKMMPPAAFGTVTNEQIDLVRQWIASGANP